MNLPPPEDQLAALKQKQAELEKARADRGGWQLVPLPVSFAQGLLTPPTQQVAWERISDVAGRTIDRTAPRPLAEGETPAPLRPGSKALMEANARLRETRARQERVIEARLRELNPDPVDRGREEARAALGSALSTALSTGLLSEDQVLRMIAVTGINDTSLTREEARLQTATCLAQAVWAELIPESRADLMLELLDADQPSKEDTLARRAAAYTRLEDLVYEALLIRPCHNPEHADVHRARATVCADQLAPLFLGLLAALGVPTDGLPRTDHREEDGRRAPCCAQDGRVGTWLVYGQTVAPSLISKTPTGPS